MYRRSLLNEPWFMVVTKIIHLWRWFNQCFDSYKLASFHVSLPFLNHMFKYYLFYTFWNVKKLLQLKYKWHASVTHTRVKILIRTKLICIKNHHCKIVSALWFPLKNTYIINYHKISLCKKSIYSSYSTKLIEQKQNNVIHIYNSLKRKCSWS